MRNKTARQHGTNNCVRKPSPEYHTPRLGGSKALTVRRVQSGCNRSSARLTCAARVAAKAPEDVRLGGSGKKRTKEKHRGIDQSQGPSGQTECYLPARPGSRRRFVSVAHQLQRGARTLA